MSVFNNKDTLEPLLGKIWITKSIDFSNGEKYQNINICFQSADNEFIAIDYMRLEPDGVYYKKNKRLGRMGDASLRKYFEDEYGGLVIEQNSAADIEGGAVFDDVARLYGEGKSLKAIARETAISEQKVRKILITKKLYSSEVSDKILALLDEGKGMDEISKELGIKRGAISSYLPYGYETASR